LPDAFIAHAIDPAKNNPGALERTCGATVSSLVSKALFLLALILGAFSFVSQEYSSAQSLLTVDIKACAAPTVASLANFTRVNCVADELLSCASPFAGTNPDLAALPLAFTYRQTLHMVGFTIMLLASAALLSAELVFLRLIITRRQLLAARILPFYAYLRHVKLPCTREPWDSRRGGGQCCACCGHRCLGNRWCGLHCCGRSVPLCTIVPQLAAIFIVFLCYYIFKTLSVYNVVSQNAWQNPQLFHSWGGKTLYVNTVLCSLANGTTAVPFQLLLDVDGAVTTLMGGGQLLFSVFPQVLLAVVLVLLAFVPALSDIYSSDGDALSGVSLFGFVHCLGAKAGTVCGHHELLPRPAGQRNPTPLRIGAAAARGHSVFVPSRFIAVEESLLEEVLWDLQMARDPVPTSRCRGCVRRWRFSMWPASPEDQGVGTGEVLLEVALRLAHAEPLGAEDESKAVRCEMLARTLRDALVAGRRAAGLVENPLAAARSAALPVGWKRIEQDEEVWFESSDGHTQWERPTTPFVP